MFYSIAKFIVGIYYFFFHRVKVSGSHNIPKNGSFILCSNHVSVSDPMVLGIFIKRPISFLAKKEIYKNWLFTMVLKGLKTIPVDRSSVSMATFKSVLKTLEDGNGVGIFAQGTRVLESENKDAKSGVALFATKSGSPVIPVCISSTFKLFSKIHINIGTPLEFSDYKDKKIKSPQLQLIAENIMEAVSNLKIEV